MNLIACIVMIAGASFGGSVFILTFSFVRDIIFNRIKSIIFFEIIGLIVSIMGVYCSIKYLNFLLS